MSTKEEKIIRHKYGILMRRLKDHYSTLAQLYKDQSKYSPDTFKQLVDTYHKHINNTEDELERLVLSK